MDWVGVQCSRSVHYGVGGTCSRTGSTNVCFCIFAYLNMEDGPLRRDPFIMKRMVKTCSL